MSTTRNTAVRESTSRGRLAGVLGLSLLAAAVFVFRAVRTATGDSPLSGFEVVGIVLASAAAVLVVTAAVRARHGLRRAAVPIGVALALELLVLNAFVAPPRLVTAIPLLFALGLAVVPERPEGATGKSGSWTLKNVLSVVALALMVPVGFAYLTTGLVASMPDLLGAYLLFGALLTAAIWLATRRSWWVVALPFLSAGLWVLMIWLGERFLDWSP